MRKYIPLIALAALASGSAVAAPRLHPEEQLARALDGRVAGRPVNCIDTRQASSRIIEGTAIIYKVGRTLYVNRPRVGAEDLERRSTLATRTISTRLCDIDTVQLFDLQARMMTGIVFLGEFVPYRRPR